jgi:serine protease AprX
VQMSTGTSIACAEASGVAALVLARQPKATPDALRKILTGTARPLAEDSSAAGAGLIDAAAAVRGK